MLQKITISILLFISLFFKLNAQATWTYAGGNGSTGAEVSRGVCTDAAGNIYEIGQFSNTVDLDYGAGTANVTSAGSNDIFIASYTSAGAYRWSLRAGNTTNDNGVSICTNGTDVYAYGFYATSATFGSTTLNSSGVSDAFLVKLNASTGAVTWAVTHGGSASDTPAAMCLDATGNIYTIESYNTSWSACSAYTSIGSSDLLIQKINPTNGACIWASTGGSTSGDGGSGSGICYVPASNKIVVSTEFSGPLATFGTFSLTNVNGGSVQTDMAVIELDASTGNFMSAISFGTATGDDASSCVYDPSTGDVFISGGFPSNVTLPNGGPGITLTTAGANDIWLGRYSPVNHNFVWAKSAGGTGGTINDERSYGVTSDGAGTIAITGSHLSNPTNFGSFSLSNTTGGGQIFIAGYNAVNGTELWVTNAITSATSALHSAGRGITTNFNSGTYWITGTFCNTTTFGAQPGITSAGFADLFNAKFTAPILVTCTTPTLTLSSQTNVLCNGGSTGSATVSATGGAPYTYTWSPSGGNAATASGLSAGVYTCVTTNSCGLTASRTVTITQPATALSASNSVTNVLCRSAATGAINLTPAGGTSPYTFNWGGGITTEDRTGLIAGAYTCTITDNNGCTTTSNATITQPASALSASNVVTNISCFGGSNGAINLTAAGGTAGYTFNWGGGVTTEDRTGLLAGAYTCTITDANGCTTTSNATVTQPASALSASNVVTNILCRGAATGAINLTATGGTGAYTYNWGGGITTEDRTGLLSGAYTCTITDANGCTTISNATITQPATALSASNVVTNISCFAGSNGAINLTPVGGTGVYTFLWNTGHTTEDRTGLLAGAYTCTITDANGCTTTSNATITQPATALSASNVVTNISCFGGSNGAINLTPAGGTGAYTFLWSTGHTAEDRTGLLAGAYTCTITDANGCTTTSNATITQPATALSASNVVTNISCFGGSNGTINLTATGGTGAYTFLWSTGHTTEDRTGLLAGAYTCTITDANGCTTTSNAIVTQPASALATSTAVTNISCNGGSNGSATVTATGGTGAYIYLWSSAQTTSVITGQIAGIRTVTVTDANGCTSSKSISITQPASALSASNVVTNISCFGGSNGAINLTPNGGTGAYTYNWGGGITTEDRTGLLSGAYTCTITDANGCTTTSNATVTQPSALITSTAVTNILCNGGSTGSATVTASGGTSPYTYLWSSAQTTSVISGQTVGVRTVTVTDANGCISSKSTNITQPASALFASNVVTNVSCNGGSNGAINLTPTGGTTAYIFNWGGGITTEDRTGLLAGAYTCTITDANGCTTTSNATVTQPASALAATISSTNTACLSNTGVANVSASGGSPSYTYSWSPSGGTSATASALGIGSYSCVIMDANLCSITKTINITTSGAPTATIIAQTNVTCNSLCNGSATVSASGGTTPYNYIWSNGNSTTIATNLCAGVVTCTVIGSNGCSTVVNTTITQPTVLSANATASAILCNGGVSTITVTATGGTSSYTGIGTFTTLAGTKSYTVTDANGCSTTTSITITQPTVLSANSFASSILCNGGISTITVSATGGTASYIGVGTFTTLVGTKSYTVTDANGCSTTTSISVSEPSVLTANASASSILCNGSVSTITVTATGGTSSYTGVGTFTTLAGTKTYTITDANGCSATTSITVSEPSVLTANASASSVLCNGGVSTITVSATGGTTSYSGVGTFTANAGIQNYTVTDANGCSTTTSVSITEPIALVSSQSLTLCAGQSITVGTSTYNTSGTYTNVLSAINGCDSTVTTNLIVNPAIVSSQTVTLCAGQTLTIGSNTYTTTGIYTNTFIAVNGCDSTLTTDLTINSAIVSSQTITLCSGQSLVVGANTYTATGVYTNTFTAVSGCDSTVTTNLNINNAINVATTLNGLTISANEISATYQWIDCDNSNQPIAGETNQNFTASANGNYAVIVTQNTCFDTSACVNISTVGVKDVNDLAGFKLYPNPTNNSFIISGLEINTNINIYNTIGELVKSIQSTDNNTTIDLSDYSNGIYLIKTKSNKGEATQKLIKQ